MPGSFLDDFTSSSQASSIKGKGPAKGGTRKRKRSGTDTAAAAGILSRQHTVASDVDPQTASSSSDRVLVAKAAVQEDLPMVSCKDLDHLVSHLFAKVEYRTLCDHEDPDGSPVDDQHVRCNVLARIYAIPLDTLGLNSRLDSVGRRDLRAGSRRRIAENAFRRLLHHLRFDLLEWLTGEVVKRAPFLLPRHQVRLSAALPSRKNRTIKLGDLSTLCLTLLDPLPRSHRHCKRSTTTWTTPLQLFSRI